MTFSAPPPGIYVPAVLFFTEDEDLDVVAIQSHVLRLAEVNAVDLPGCLSLTHRGTIRVV